MLTPRVRVTGEVKDVAKLVHELTGALDLGDLQNGVAVGSPADLDLLRGRVVRVVVREHHWLGDTCVVIHHRGEPGAG